MSTDSASTQNDFSQGDQDEDTQDETYDPLGSPPETAKNTKAVLGSGIPGGRRQNAVRLIIPPEKFGDINFIDTLDGAIVRIIRDVQPKINVAQTGVLMYPAPIGFVIVLYCVLRGIDERSIKQAEISSFQEGVNRTAQNPLKEAAKNHTERLGIETGTLDLDPVGISPVTTSRLLLEEDNVIGTLSSRESTPLAEILKTLKQNYEAFIYDLIVGGSGGTDGYLGSVRLATYNPQYNYTGDRGFAELVEKGSPVDLANEYSRLNLTSNHRLETDHVLKTDYSERIDGTVDATVEYNYITENQYRTKYDIRKEADKLKELVRGGPEYPGIRTGNASRNVWAYKQYPKNDNRERYGWFNIEPAQLSLFAECVPLRMEYNPWELLNGRSAPVFDTDEVVRSVKHLKQSKGVSIDNAPERPATIANNGGVDHQALVNISDRWFTEQGDCIMVVEQNTDSVPDLWLSADDGLIVSLNSRVDSEVVAVEAECQNKSKPAGPLTNAERAYACDHHAIFVYESESDAKKGYKPLFTSYRNQTDFGVWLYNGKEPITCSDGRTPVAKGASQTTTATWEINAAGTKRLSVGETELEFAPGESLEDGDFEYYHREVDNTHRIETADGDTVEEYTGDTAFKANWTKIACPHHPADYHYGQHITVMYRDEDTDAGIEELKRYTPSPEWYDDFEAETGTIDKLKVAMDNFLKDLVVEAEDEKLPYSDLQDQFRSYCEQWLSIEPPTNSVIGRTLPEDLKDAKTGGTDNRNPYFDGYAFCFPENREVLDEIASELDVPDSQDIAAETPSITE